MKQTMQGFILVEPYLELLQKLNVAVVIFSRATIANLCLPASTFHVNFSLESDRQPRCFECFCFCFQSDRFVRAIQMLSTF